MKPTLTLDSIVNCLGPSLDFWMYCLQAPFFHGVGSIMVVMDLLFISHRYIVVYYILVYAHGPGIVWNWGRVRFRETDHHHTDNQATSRLSHLLFY